MPSTRPIVVVCCSTQRPGNNPSPKTGNRSQTCSAIVRSGATTLILKMSLLENTTCALPIHPPRPVLKRARIPYSPPEESKRRRTSPTGAFSRLSISPTSQRAASPHHHEQPVQEHDPASSPWSFILHRKHSPLPRQDARPSAPSPSICTDVRMRTGYSAYEPEPNRIIVESLSDTSDTPSLQQEEEEEEEEEQKNPSQISFEVDPEVARHLATREKDQHHPSAMFLNSHHFISAQPDEPLNNQQLVLYRKPICPPLHIPFASSPTPIPVDNDDLIIDVDLVHQPLVSPLPSPTQADLMDTD
ncbi:hypothetical protein PCASD_10764 [Puccinia coronata f. sp. avenae]|uniref:Uncharacterized protein n=2 Tax=Puccinia coronata f. sp. avenae TaxID=200324 RepID=A0A2N5UT13_9BASI|nr:hypothetical protein PCASD_10764 [Puccinia coronata f. sp. avenae]